MKRKYWGYSECIFCSATISSVSPPPSYRIFIFFPISLSQYLQYFSGTFSSFYFPLFACNFHFHFHCFFTYPSTPYPFIYFIPFSLRHILIQNIFPQNDNLRVFFLTYSNGTQRGYQTYGGMPTIPVSSDCSLENDICLISARFLYEQKSTMYYRIYLISENKQTKSERYPYRV